MSKQPTTTHSAHSQLSKLTLRAAIRRAKFCCKHLALAAGLVWLPLQLPAQIEQVVRSFGFPNESGSAPEAAMVQGTDGALYGTTQVGGSYGEGTVFRILPDGTGYTVLCSFFANGRDQQIVVAQGTDGFLYGTTQCGGVSNTGTIFRLSTNGTGYALLHSFIGGRHDGVGPVAGVVQGADGVLYGTTKLGGTNGDGMVFSIATNGSGFKALYSFTGINADGAWPMGGLIQGTDGALYGTTETGGTNEGTVFKLNTDGSGYNVLHGFAGVADGGQPMSKMVQGADGALYGTTTGKRGQTITWFVF
jgi:uncharacterized repeat protein (TIGR03803 family)